MFLDKDLVDVLVKANWSIEKAERHDLIPKVAILDMKHYSPFVTLSN